MAKRLAIQRGEDIVTDQELMGLGLSSVLCALFQAMPPTGGMSRTAVNLQNAHSQVSSILTVAVIILSLYTLTGTLYFIPKATLASIIIVAGYSLVEFPEAKWLYKVRRDEFYVWLASFVLTLGLGIVQGLIGSIVSSVLALMIKTKRPTVAILGENENGALVDRAHFPDAKHLGDIVAVRVEGSLYFANCEYVGVAILREIDQMKALHTISVRSVIVDAFHMNDWDATTIQVISDLQEKLQYRKMRFAITNANGRLHAMLLQTSLAKRIVANDPSITLDTAVRILRNQATLAETSAV